MQAFQIGEREAEYVRVSILRDNHDGWLSAQVELRVGAFAAEFGADFNSWAFSDFATQLREMYCTLAGSAVFTSYERQLELQLQCDVRGAIVLRGEATDYAGTGNRLHFSLKLDQTYLPPILADLERVSAAYPRRAV